MPAHFLRRRLQVAIKNESTAGMHIAPVAADVTMRFQDGAEFDISGFESLERGLTGADIGMEPNLIGLQPVTITLTAEIAGSGTAGTAPPIGKLLELAGYNETVVASTSVAYNPESAPTGGTASIGLWRGPDDGSSGMLELAKGCRCTSHRFILTPGQIPRLEMTWMGAFVSRSDAAAYSTVTYATVQPPQVVKRTGLTMAAWSPVFTEFSIDVDRGGFMMPDADQTPGGSDTSGLTYARLTDKVITGSLTFVDVLESEEAWIDDVLSSTELDTNLQLGATAGNIVDFDIDALQLMPPSNTDVNNLMGRSIPFQANRAATADTDLVITFT